MDGPPVPSARQRRISLMIERVGTARALAPRLVRDAIVIALLIDAGYRGWRLYTAGGFIAGVALAPVLIHLGRRAGGSVERRGFVIALVAQLLSVGVMILTGGLHSPVLPGVAAMIILPARMYADERRSDLLSVVLVLSCAAVGWFPGWLTGPPLPRFHYVAIMMVTMAWGMLVAHLIFRRVHAVTAASEQALLDQRAAQVADAEAATRRLQLVGARVAHELKNPLAAIKGLVQLVARALPAPRDGRLDDVLAEIARVEGTVKAYLSFARPVDDTAAPPPVPTLADLRRDRSRTLTAEAARLITVLTIFTIGLAVGQVLVLALAGAPTWRVVAIGAAFVLVGLVHRLDAYLISERGPPRETIDLQYQVNTVVGQVWVAVLLVLSGGLYSPFIATASIHMVVLEPLDVRNSWLYGSLMMVWMLAVALVPAAWTGAIITGWHHDLGMVVTLVWAVVIIRTTSTSSAAAGDLAEAKIDTVRAERVRSAGAMAQRLRDVAARVADELGPPLAAMHATVSDVLADTREPRPRERLAVVAREIARIQIIVGDYLSATRPLEDLDPEAVDLAALAGESAAVVAGRAEHGKVAVELHTGAARLRADPRRLREALLNVLSNALDATPAGGTVRIATAPTDGGGATITVEDTGRGMAPELLARLGQSFVTTRSEGTGLGVTLIQGVVSRHGGTVAFASELGRGTRVTITLPAQPP